MHRYTNIAHQNDKWSLFIIGVPTACRRDGVADASYVSERHVRILNSALSGPNERNRTGLMVAGTPHPPSTHTDTRERALITMATGQVRLGERRIYLVEVSEVGSVIKLNVKTNRNSGQR